MNAISLVKNSFLFVVACNILVDICHKVLLQNIAFKVFDGSTQVVWISIINALIIIPFLLLFTFSGYLSDKYNKRDILVIGGVSSFCLSVLMIIAYHTGNFYFAMLILVLLAVQSAIYSPAKFGIILDIYGKDNLSKGNSSLQALSMIAILFSIASTSYIFENYYIVNSLENLKTKEELLEAIIPLSYYILPIAFLEMIVSVLFFRKFQFSFNKNRKLQLDKKAFFKGKLLVKNIKLLFLNKVIFLCVIGLSIFWAISQGLLAVFPSFAKQYLQITNVFVINAVLAASGIGIAIGSYIYSKISKHYIEIGTIPFASIGMAITIFLATLIESTTLLFFCFLFFGIFGGLFVVPLNSLIQFNADRKKLGTILAGNNWFHSIGMFLMLCLTTIVSFYHLSSFNTIYIIFCITIIGTSYTIYKLPQSLILLFLKFVVGLKYKFKVNGIKNLPSTGGVLLLGNHVSWLDWAVIFMSSPRQIRFVMHKPIYDKWYLTWVLKLFKAIPISNGFSKSTLQNIAKILDNGEVVVLFPEGGITRNGHLGDFKKGFEKILDLSSSDVKVVCFYIQGLWESMFSRANKKFIKNRKTNLVTVSFSKMIKKQNATLVSVKKEIISLSTKSWIEHIKELETIPCEIFNRLKELKNDNIITDSTGVTLSATKYLTASILFKDLFKNISEQNIGVMLPASSAGSFINTSLLMLGKSVVNINYTSSFQILTSALIKAEVKTIITSNKFIKKLKEKGLDLQDLENKFKLIFLEEEKEKISKIKGLLTLISVRVLPALILKTLHIKNISKSSTALIMFSSGSENIPKAIELTHDNIVGNCSQIANILNVHEEDIILGSLPLFHAFGIVVTTFMPLLEGIFTVCSADPTDSTTIGKLVYKYKVTIMCGTSTFFRLYTLNKRVESVMFDSLRFVIAGAEKLNEKVKEEFKTKFNKEILEGYGTTETSPVATCNLPDILTSDFTVQKGSKIGSVGMPIPGTMIKIVNPDTFKELEVEEEGMVLISGIQVMNGYLKDKAKTKEVLKTIDNRIWYITGDKGRLDKEGFLTIVDRYSRFAKIGGEMISLSLIEKKIEEFLNDEVEIAATSIKDEKKGEKIILLLSNITTENLELLKKQIIEKFDNNLMIPSIYKIVKEIPKLGSGKRDFNTIKKLAL